MGPEQKQTEELRREQLLEERAERERAAEAAEEQGGQTHRRRAEKAGYLREKLEERERSERESGD